LNAILALRRGAVAICVTLVLVGCAASRKHADGLAAMEKGDYAVAVRALQQAAELAPRDIAYQQDWLTNRAAATDKLLARAEEAKGQGKLPAAESAYREILAFDAHNSRALAGLDGLVELIKAKQELEHVTAAIKRKDWDTASRLIARVAERVPEMAEVRELRREIAREQTYTAPSEASLGAAYHKPINLEFKDAGLKFIFDALSRTTGINFIFDRDVKADQRTTISVKQTTLDDAIDVILATNQLEKKVLNGTSVLIYPNTPAKQREYQELLVRAFYMSNIDAKTGANLLKSVLKLKDVYVDEKFHLIVLREPPETIALAEKLLALQDLEEPEVMIEVEVLEVNRSNLLNLGVQLSNQLTVTPLNGASTVGSSTTNPTYKLDDLKNLNSGMLGITLPSATLSLQKTVGNANLLANPRLRVRDRDKAKILIGDKVPIVTTTSTPNGFLAESIQYQDVGLKLDVEPEIHLRDEVSLKVALEVSSIVAAVKTSTGTQAYQIGTRNFNSSLRLRDGETQVLAGLISDTDRRDANRIPLLGDLPLLGRLFSSQKDDRQKTEIVLSITPRLIRNVARKDAGAEVFWSGTEANLSTRTVQLRDFPSAQPAGSAATGTGAKAAKAPAGSVIAQAATGGATAASASAQSKDFELRWSGPNEVRAGDTFKLELHCRSRDALRAAPLQMFINPKHFEVVSVKPGAVFPQDSGSSFTSRYDAASGNLSVGMSTSAPGGTKGEGVLLTLELKAVEPAADAAVAVGGITPVGVALALARPALPLAHPVMIAR
jgi:general secretion pathway protein D